METILSTLFVIVLVFGIPSYLRHRKRERLAKFARAISVDIALLTADFLKNKENKDDIDGHAIYVVNFDFFSNEQDALISLHACILSLTVLFAVAYPTRNFKFADNVLSFMLDGNFPKTRTKAIEVYNLAVTTINHCLKHNVQTSPGEIMSQVLVANHVGKFDPLNISIISHVTDNYVLLKSKYPQFYANVLSN